MITSPPVPRSKLSKRTIALIVTGASAMASLCLAGAVTVTIRSGVLDRLMDTAEDTQALAQLRKGGCLETLPQPEPGDTQGRKVRPPKVIDCDAPNAEWVVDDESHGVPLELFNRYVEHGKVADSSEMCDTDPARLAYVYAVRESTGRTVTAYCIVLKPIGWHPEDQ